MAKRGKSKKIQKKYPERSRDVPITQVMLFEVRDELIARMGGFNKRMDGFDARMDGLDARMDRLDARMDGLDAKIDKLSSKVDQRFHEIKLLVEEQNARNRIVLDGLTNLFARQERMEKRLGWKY